MSSIIKAGALGTRQAAANGGTRHEPLPGGATMPGAEGNSLPQHSLRIQRTATRILIRARQEAASLLAAAEAAAQSLKEQARVEGYAAGLKAGKEKGHGEGLAEGLATGFSSGIDRAREVLDTAETVLAEAERQRSEALAGMETDILELALAIAEKLVQREIQLDEEYLPRLISWGVKQMGDTDRVVARVCPVSNEGAPVAAVLQNMGDRLQVVVDEELEPGDCVIETGGRLLDGRLHTRLTNIRQALEDVVAQ